MPERSIGAVSKTVVPLWGTVGSNPTLSAKYRNISLINWEILQQAKSYPQIYPQLGVRLRETAEREQEAIACDRQRNLRLLGSIFAAQSSLNAFPASDLGGYRASTTR